MGVKDSLSKISSSSNHELFLFTLQNTVATKATVPLCWELHKHMVLPTPGSKEMTALLQFLKKNVQVEHIFWQNSSQAVIFFLLSWRGIEHDLRASQRSDDLPYFWCSYPRSYSGKADRSRKSSFPQNNSTSFSLLCSSLIFLWYSNGRTSEPEKYHLALHFTTQHRADFSFSPFNWGGCLFSW